MDLVELLYKKAYKKDPKKTTDLVEIFHSTDMKMDEFVAHLRIIAGVKKTRGDHRCECWYCGGKLCWDSDYPYDEVHGDGEGIVTMLHCNSCGATVQYSLKDEEN